VQAWSIAASFTVEVGPVNLVGLAATCQFQGSPAPHHKHPRVRPADQTRPGQAEQRGILSCPRRSISESRLALPCIALSFYLVSHLVFFFFPFSTVRLCSASFSQLDLFRILLRTLLLHPPSPPARPRRDTIRSGERDRQAWSGPLRSLVARKIIPHSPPVSSIPPTTRIGPSWAPVTQVAACPDCEIMSRIELAIPKTLGHARDSIS
jgi:hypothetical protein